MPPRAGGWGRLEREGGTTPPWRPPLLFAYPRPVGVGVAFPLFLGRGKRDEAGCANHAAGHGGRGGSHEARGAP
eukprot:8888435-Pyramimonas_sp.AAC.1